MKKSATRPSSAASLRAERAAQLAERELLQLIFLPGFSTAAAVTNVSGRGVGMDVVRTNVEKIGGKVEIDSRAGKGTTLRLRIPLTLAIIPALIVRSLNQSFALPQGALSELVHIPPEQAATAIEWIEDAPLYRLRGRLLPLVFLDAPADARPRSASWPPIATTSSPCSTPMAAASAWSSTRLADPEEIVVKPLSAVLKDIGLYSGATVLGNADLALILDPGSIAMKAGVTMSSDEESAQRGRRRERRRSVKMRISAGRGRRTPGRRAAGRRAAHRAASALAHRVHRLPAGAQLRGPVAARSRIRAASSPRQQGNPEAQIVVVVCREGNRHVGIAVSHVLDVAAGSRSLRGRHRRRGPTASRCSRIA